MWAAGKVAGGGAVRILCRAADHEEGGIPVPLRGGHSVSKRSRPSDSQVGLRMQELSESQREALL